MARNAALALGGVLLVVLLLRLTVWSTPAQEVDSAQAPKAPAMALRVGDLSPRFTLTDQDGQRVSVGGPSARWTVLSFFRQALSPW